jgi:hypothetical protein
LKNFTVGLIELREHPAFGRALRSYLVGDVAGKEWPGKMIYLNFDSIFGDFFLKFFEEEVSDYLS